MLGVVQKFRAWRKHSSEAAERDDRATIRAPLATSLSLNYSRGAGGWLLEGRLCEANPTSCDCVFTVQLVFRRPQFRRSAFRSDEPKVSLLAPSVLGAWQLHNAMLITECGRLEQEAGGLILLVRRWATDRVVCHAAKVNLPPCKWTLLTSYFLQVDVEVEGAVPPTLDELKISCCLDGNTIILLPEFMFSHLTTFESGSALQAELVSSLPFICKVL